MPGQEDAALGMKVREATIDDAAEVYALAAELAAAIGDASPELEDVRARLGELLEEPRARILVAEGNEEIAGVVSVWIKPDLAHGDTVVEVPMLVVSESARRNGVGKLLMDAVQGIAADNKAGLIELVATGGNVAAREFYSSLGFIEADVVALEFIGDVEDPPDSEEPRG